MERYQHFKSANGVYRGACRGKENYHLWSIFIYHMVRQTLYKAVKMKFSTIIKSLFAGKTMHRDKKNWSLLKKKITFRTINL